MNARFTLRDESPKDHAAIGVLLEEAFGGPSEARLVERLRSLCDELVSIVAEADGAVVGHILFSPVRLGETRGMGLAPMAVTPALQRTGIGSALVAAGLERLGAAGCPFVVVLGHPEYYPRFGFEPASKRGVSCEWDVPDEVFLFLALDEEAVADLSGTASYRPEFEELGGI